MVLKEALLTESMFNCPLFVVNGAECDPGTGANCLKSDGTVETMNKACDVAALSTYIDEFPNRITQVIQQLDSEVLIGLDKINNQTRALVTKYLVTPITDVANDVTCGFFGTFYKEVVESFCYQGIYGLRQIAWSYVSIGILTIFFIVMMFAVWRRTTDNRNLWEEEGQGTNKPNQNQSV